MHTPSVQTKSLNPPDSSEPIKYAPNPPLVRFPLANSDGTLNNTVADKSVDKSNDIASKDWSILIQAQTRAVQLLKDIRLISTELSTSSPVLAQPKLTPLELANGQRAANNAAASLQRLLATLDEAVKKTDKPSAAACPPAEK